jgi:hypothetical protein
MILFLEVMMTSSGWEISFRKISFKGSSPKWKDTFFIDDKGGEIYQM